MEATTYNQKGTEEGKVTLPEHIFGLPWNSDLVHQVVVSLTSSARSNIAHVKTRGEVRGGGKKPWQQKGTGRARHGSSRSPIWVGGGVTHGPRNDKNYDRKVNKKMKTKALFTILSRKYRDGEVFFVDSLSIKDGKTKEGAATIKNLSKIGFVSIDKKPKNALYIALGETDLNTVRGLRNVSNVSVQEIRNLSPLTLLQYRNVLIVSPAASIKILESKMDKQKDVVEGEENKTKAPRKVKKVVDKKKPAKAKK